ncbi:hypothetical protein Mpsy_1101 [Methanolobus psychrophilus R15]|nr:hypothetical protein Mpsy_1101 [Methanolobus psychrophilus R15]
MNELEKYIENEAQRIYKEIINEAQLTGKPPREIARQRGFHI